MRRSLLALGLAIAATRLMAVSRSLWDWDEVLYSDALNDYDVGAHRPHPPGFPLYVALAKVLRLVAPSDFRAYQTVVVLAAFLVFPALYFLARSFGFDRAVAATSATIFSFLPNIWFYGGTAFSDVPATVVVIAAAAMLFRGREDRDVASRESRVGSPSPTSDSRPATRDRDFLIGCVLLGASIIFRPQNVLLGAWPWMVAAWPRVRARKLGSIALGAVLATIVVVAGYGGAALATGSWQRYRDAVRGHSQYVMTIDSYRNPGRPPIPELFMEWADPYHAGKVTIVLLALLVLGLATGRKPALHAVLTFGPFFFFAWFMLDITGTSRLSIGYMPLLALLAGAGVVTLARWLSFGRPRLRAVLNIVFVMALLARLIPWTNRALREVRRNDAPSYAAIQWVRKNLDPKTTTMYVHGSMGPFAEYLLKDYPQIPIPDDFTAEGVKDTTGAWLIQEGATASSGAVNFRRRRNQIFNIARKRYFEVSVRPLSSEARFTDGWYGEESMGTEVWRWMGRSSLTRLAPLRGKGELKIGFYVPLDTLKTPQTVTITFNDVPVDRFLADKADMEKTYVLDSRDGAPNDLRIEVDKVLNPAAAGIARDSRDLGLQLRSFSWQSAR